MAKIVINTESFATEKIVQDIQTAASEANPNNAAEVVRDSNGKVVKVTVNLPDNTSAQGIATATAKINANLGVASATSFPIVSNSDFNTLTPAAVLAAPGTIYLLDLTVKSQLENSGSTTVVAAASTDSVGAIGSALEIKEGPTTSAISRTNHNTYSSLVTYSSTNGIALINAYQHKFLLKMKSNGFDISEEITVEMGNGWDAAQVYAGQSWLPNTTNWFISVDGPSGVVDTGVPKTNFLDLIMGLDEVGILYIEADFSTANISKQSTMGGKTSISVSSDIRCQNSVARTGSAASLIIDNLEVKILSGSV